MRTVLANFLEWVEKSTYFKEDNDITVSQMVNEFCNITPSIDIDLREVLRDWTTLVKQRNDEMRSDYGKAMDAYDKEVERYNQRLYKVLMKLKGQHFMDSLNECFTESECRDKVSIVRKPRGHYQRENYGRIKGIWVDQWSVGDSGDSYEGYIAVKIRQSTWIECRFEC